MQNTPRRLPPLDLLLTFESAARHLSFTRAGEERFITQSAVSRQVRALEDDLGVTLFTRRHRSLELTPSGRMLAESCADAIGQLRDTVARLRAPRARKIVTVTTTPGLASLWLIPRLAGFTGEHPGVDVRIDVSFERRDLERDGIDIAVRYLPGDRPEGRRLFAEEALPVCSPSLLGDASRPLRGAADLAHHTLLRIDEPARSAMPMQDWQPWLTAMGVPDLEPGAVIAFSNYDDLIAAAVLGQGVALGRRPLVDALLENGSLVAPIEGTIASPHAYFVVVNPATRERAEARALADWLIAQACSAPVTR